MAKLLLTVFDVKAEFWTTKHNVKINYTCANTDGWGNKLVTIFARHLDSFIVMINFSLTYQIRDFGSGQILSTGTTLSFVGICKNCAIPSLHRDSFLAKVIRNLPGASVG